MNDRQVAQSIDGQSKVFRTGRNVLFAETDDYGACKYRLLNSLEEALKEINESSGFSEDQALNVVEAFEDMEGAV